MLTPRIKMVLKCIVDEFIQTAEPVSSKVLVDKYHLPYSSATIRNDMGVLEDLGYIEKPYSSSGRVPSTYGYKYYCEYLLEHKVDDDIKYAIESIFKNRSLSIEEAIYESCEIVSEMTKLTTGVLGPDCSNSRLEHIKLFQIDDKSAVCVFITDNGHTESKKFSFNTIVSLSDIDKCVEILNERLKGSLVSELSEKLTLIKPILSTKVKKYEVLFNAFISAFAKFTSDNVYFSKNNSIVYQPEFNDVEKLKQLMRIMENELVWKNFRSSKLDLVLKNGVNSQMAWIDDVAVISNKIQVNGNDAGEIMVLGPSRMEYNKIVGLLGYISNVINEIYKSED